MAAALPASAEAIAEPTGVPKPVHASQPGPAENVPLFPLVMSWKVPLTCATCEYKSEQSAYSLAKGLVDTSGEASPKWGHSACAAYYGSLSVDVDVVARDRVGIS